MTEPEQQTESRSSVKIDMNAKGMAQPKISVYEGTSEEEMQRIKDLAMNTYLTLVRELAQRSTIAQA